jgi:hypothetical protein
MDIYDFIDQFLKIREKEIENKVWELWLVKLPQMNSDNYMSYDEMLDMVKRSDTNKPMQKNEVFIDQCFF